MSNQQTESFPYILALQFLIANLLIAIFERESTSGADIHAFATVPALELAKAFTLEGAYDPLETAVGKAKLPAYPDAPTTKNAFIGVVDKQFAAVIYRKFLHKFL